MVSSWEKLPKELLKDIFSTFAHYVSDESLLQLQLTCKSWGQVAKEVFYKRDIYVTCISAPQLMKRLKYPNDATRLLIRALTLEDNVLSTIYFKQLLLLCPNLISVYIFETTHIENHAEIFYPTLYELRCNGYLKKLERIWVPLYILGRVYPPPFYNDALIQFRDSLTHLQIIDSIYFEQKCHAPPQHFVEWFDRLMIFSRLKSLKVEVSSLTYLCELDPFMQKLGLSVETVSITFTNDRVLGPLKQADVDNTLPQIKKLKIKMEIFRLQDLDYIMLKFTNVVDLRIDVLGTLTDLESSLVLGDAHSASLSHQFFKYLKDIPKFKLTNISIANDSLRQILLSLNMYFNVKILYLSFIISTTTETTFSFKSTQSTLHNQRGGELDLEISTAESVSSLQDILHSFRESVQHLTIKCVSTSLPYHENQVYRLYENASIIAINTFHSLKSLSLFSTHILSLAPIAKPEASKLSLDFLSINSDEINSDVLLELSQRISYIKRFSLTLGQWLTGYISRENSAEEHVINMPYTAFEEIWDKDINSDSCIAKICTASNTVYHKIERYKGSMLATREDYNSLTTNDNTTHIRKLTIYCAQLKRFKAFSTTIIL